MALNINVQNVKAPPMLFKNTGVSWVINTTPIHNINTEKDMAIPLTLVGKISAINTHGIGPRDIANDAIKPKTNNNSQGPELDSM